MDINAIFCTNPLMWPQVTVCGYKSSNSSGRASQALWERIIGSIGPFIQKHNGEVRHWYGMAGLGGFAQIHHKCVLRCVVVRPQKSFLTECDHPCLMVLLFCTGMPSCWKQRLEFQTVPKEDISLNVLVSGSLNSSLWKAGSQSFYSIDIKRQNNCFNITGRFTATVNLHSNFGAIRKWHW